MISTIIMLAIVCAGALALAKSCGDFESYEALYKATFLPMNKREFWFPKCALCWIARGCVVAAFVLGMVQGYGVA